jgi:hypothetical protein
MHWRKLVQGSELFEALEPLDHFYWDYLAVHSPESWISEEGPTDLEVARLVLFINQWSTHYPTAEGSLVALREAFCEVQPLLRELVKLDLVRADFDGEILPDMKLRDAVETVFEYLATCGRRFESTGTSNMLHMINPHFFVMWDDRIRGGYGSIASGRNYGQHFLPLMRRELQGAVGSYTMETRSPEDSGRWKLEALRSPRTLPKVLDEYNYVKFTLRLPELWES